jgi:hypothetical protein
MDTMTIHVLGAGSAREMLVALAAFQAKLVEIADGYLVVITLTAGERGVVGLLGALQQYMTERADQPPDLDVMGQDAQHRS